MGAARQGPARTAASGSAGGIGRLLLLRVAVTTSRGSQPRVRPAASAASYSCASPSTRIVTMSVPWYCWWRTDEA